MENTCTLKLDRMTVCVDHLRENRYMKNLTSSAPQAFVSTFFIFGLKFFKFIILLFCRDEGSRLLPQSCLRLG